MSGRSAGGLVEERLHRLSLQPDPLRDDELPEISDDEGVVVPGRADHEHRRVIGTDHRAAIERRQPVRRRVDGEVRPGAMSATRTT